MHIEEGKKFFIKFEFLLIEPTSKNFRTQNKFFFLTLNQIYIMNQFKMKKKSNTFYSTNIFIAFFINNLDYYITDKSTQEKKN